MAKVDILNYISDSNILRSTYDTDTNELDITDVPQNLNSVITLGQVGGEWTSDGIASMTEPNGDITLTISSIAVRGLQYRKMTGITAPNLTRIENYGCASASNLASVSMPNLSTTNAYAFQGCSSLTHISLPSLTTTNGYLCDSCSNLEEAHLPSYSSQTGSDMFGNCSKLKIVDLGNCSKIDANCFRNTTLFDTLILRRSSVTALGNTNNAMGPRFLNGGAGGEIYVPSSLIDSYKAATNWATLEAYGTITWKALEGSIYE